MVYYYIFIILLLFVKTEEMTLFANLSRKVGADESIIYSFNNKAILVLCAAGTS